MHKGYFSLPSVDFIEVHTFYSGQLGQRGINVQ